MLRAEADSSRLAGVTGPRCRCRGNTCPAARFEVRPCPAAPPSARQRQAPAGLHRRSPTTPPGNRSQCCIGIPSDSRDSWAGGRGGGGASLWSPRYLSRERRESGLRVTALVPRGSSCPAQGGAGSRPGKNETCEGRKSQNCFG